MNEKERLYFARVQSMRHQNWGVGDVVKWCIDWDEATARILMSGERDGKDKLEDAEGWRTTLRRLEGRT